MVGFPAALACGHILANQLYGVKSTDPLVLGGAALLLVASATLAGFAPGLRAGSINPVEALRTR